jgi:hypothetical protein
MYIKKESIVTVKKRLTVSKFDLEYNIKKKNIICNYKTIFFLPES